MQEIVSNSLDGVAAAIISGAIAVRLRYLATKKERPSLKRQWQAELDRVNERLEASYKDTIEDQRKQIEDEKAEVAAKDKEIARLNRLIFTIQQGRTPPHD